MRFARTLSVFAFAGMLSLPLLGSGCHENEHSRGDWDDRRAYPAGYRHDRDGDLRRDRDDSRHDRDDSRRDRD